MNHGSEPAMLDHHLFSFVDQFCQFCCFNLMCFNVFFFTLLTVQTDRISLRLIWIGVGAAVVGALALVAVTLWCCQARKKDGYLASNQAVCRSFLGLQSKRGFKKYLI